LGILIVFKSNPTNYIIERKTIQEIKPITVYAIESTRQIQTLANAIVTTGTYNQLPDAIEHRSRVSSIYQVDIDRAAVKAMPPKELT
jgi:hypothetical protein